MAKYEGNRPRERNVEFIGLWERMEKLNLSAFNSNKSVIFSNLYTRPAGKKGGRSVRRQPWLRMGRGSVSHEKVDVFALFSREFF